MTYGASDRVKSVVENETHEEVLGVNLIVFGKIEILFCDENTF